jgi:exosortase H (IPTLxxWG-CTERM-specific)
VQVSRRIRAGQIVARNVGERRSCCLWNAPFFDPYAGWNARMTAALLGPFLEGTRAQGAYLSAPTFSLHVRPGCDSYQASAVLLAGIAAFPAPLARKLIGAGLGVAALQALNLGRLAVLLWTGVHHRTLFERMHLEILPAVFVVAALVLLLGWATWVRGSPAPPAVAASR